MPIPYVHCNLTLSYSAHSVQNHTLRLAGSAMKAALQVIPAGQLLIPKQSLMKQQANLTAASLTATVFFPQRLTFLSDRAGFITQSRTMKCVMFPTCLSYGFYPAEETQAYCLTCRPTDAVSFTKTTLKVCLNLTKYSPKR